MTGELLPLPDNSIFHRTFSVRLQVKGNSGSRAIPCPVGPRKQGHCLSAPGAGRTGSITTVSMISDATLSCLAVASNSLTCSDVKSGEVCFLS